MKVDLSRNRKHVLDLSLILKLTWIQYEACHARVHLMRLFRRSRAGRARGRTAGCILAGLFRSLAYRYVYQLLIPKENR